MIEHLYLKNLGNVIAGNTLWDVTLDKGRGKYVLSVAADTDSYKGIEMGKELYVVTYQSKENDKDKGNKGGDNIAYVGTNKKMAIKVYKGLESKVGETLHIVTYDVIESKEKE
jgi:hypothetical protein